MEVFRLTQDNRLMRRGTKLAVMDEPGVEIVLGITGHTPECTGAGAFLCFNPGPGTRGSG